MEICFAHPCLQVLVHSGGVHGGHYYAYIRPRLDSQWLKFDDERVTLESEVRPLRAPLPSPASILRPQELSRDCI